MLAMHLHWTSTRNYVVCVLSILQTHDMKTSTQIFGGESKGRQLRQKGTTTITNQCPVSNRQINNRTTISLFKLFLSA